ncbi:MAG: isoleucine--tRNA ligase [Candidatus Babeliales bacterium]
MSDQNTHNESEQSKVEFYKETLNLPTTTFSIRAHHKERDAIFLKRWEEEGIAKVCVEQNKGGPYFILHDGPMYANGHIHLGHAYNKIVKDIIAKSFRMLGYHVSLIPGWDCHGLPIESKVVETTPINPPTMFKEACKEYVYKWVAIQEDEIKKLGVFMDWEHPYLTMDYAYQAEILRSFGMCVEQGYIERKYKTVPWCFSCKTVLASAEIEYEERKDPSVYVLFPLEDELDQNNTLTVKENIYFLVWTTTPWTLPLNRAIVIRPEATYLLVKAQDKYLIIAEGCAESLRGVLEEEFISVQRIAADELLAMKLYARHPFIEGLKVPVIGDQSVSVHEGTGCVHSAPGCGPEDYEVGVKHNIEIYSPINPDGTYSAEIQPNELVGMEVQKGQFRVIALLQDRGMLFAKKNIKHSYPHCWRCHTGLIFRATKQWFCNLAHNNLKERVLKSLNHITMIPEGSLNRLKAFVTNRFEWCLSRQRVWGVPIPALICLQCDTAYNTPLFIKYVAEHVQQHGIAWWDTLSIESLSDSIHVQCATCSGSKFIKETDILDVWFDSGVSHTAALKVRNEQLFPADMYVEGKDQHRGWFQSSLITSMILHDTPCMRRIITHGFTVDSQGKKMSKSLNNVVAPFEVIEQLGTDGLRLWVSSIDYTHDAVVSQALFKNVTEVYRKIRNTCRFLLSNLYDFSIDSDKIAVEEMPLIDRHALRKLFYINKEVIKAYGDTNFTYIFHTISQYCITSLSAFYLDSIKDRLYVEEKDSKTRRSAQTVCWYLLDTLVRLIAPIASFVAEDIYDHYKDATDKTLSIHMQLFSFLHDLKRHYPSEIPYVLDVKDSFMHYQFPYQFFSPESMEQDKNMWDMFGAIRDALLKEIERAREKNLIKIAQEAHVDLFCDPSILDTLYEHKDSMKKTGQTEENFFQELLLVSSCTLYKNKEAFLVKTEHDGVFVRVEKAEGVKCPRCWQWTRSNKPDGLCSRCEIIVMKALKK